jgi:hypothetical protein
VPLFVEELTKTVLESGLLREGDGAFHLAGPLPPFAIPATLQDSLMARLDRLGAVREVAQIGARIGRQFSHGLIAAVSPIRGERLDQALNQLVQAELLFQRGNPPDAIYTFKHALVQDVAYDSAAKQPARSTPGSRRPSKRKILPFWTPSPSCSRTTTPERGCSTRRFRAGAKQASGRSSVWRCRNRSPI